MLPVPPILIHWLAPFAAFFTKPTWERGEFSKTGGNDEGLPGASN